VVLLAAIGGVILVLTQGGDTQPDATITPGTPTAEPTTQAPSAQPTSASPSGRKSTPQQPTEAPNPVPSGKAITLDHGISLTPVDGYQLEKSGTGYARLSNGDQLFLGQAIAVDPGTNPGQLCDSWHRRVAEGQANGQFGKPETADLNTNNLKGATCTGRFTASNGSGSQDVVVFSLVSVRTDGVTAIGTMYFLKSADGDQLNKDFTAMMNSMLQDQATGG
jgi:bacillopeptidase F (M6 metalloprotease family)